MKEIGKVFLGLSLDVAVLSAIAGIMGLAGMVQAAFSAASEVKLTATDGAIMGRFATSVSVSGNTAVAGENLSGGRRAAHVFAGSSFLALPRSFPVLQVEGPLRESFFGPIRGINS